MSLLCVGADGHLAIETGLGSSCDTVSACVDDHGHEHEAESNAAQVISCQDHENCCGDCVDIELELDDAGLAASGLGGSFIWVALALSQSPWVTLAWPSCNLGIPENKGPPGFADTSLESFATIRLLI